MPKFRLEITKGEAIRYISHLDYSRSMERALRRAKLPVAYSEGFNPHMKMAFASALSLGVTSEAEYMDVELTEAMADESVATALAAQLPPGIAVKKVRRISDRHASLMAVVNLATYRLTLTGVDLSVAEASLASFWEAAQVVYVKESPKGRREIDVKQYVTEAAVTPLAEGVALDLTIKITPTGSVKPVEVLTALTRDFALPVDPAAALINRTGLFVTDGKLRRAPIDL